MPTAVSGREMKTMPITNPASAARQSEWLRRVDSNSSRKDIDQKSVTVCDMNEPDCSRKNGEATSSAAASTPVASSKSRRPAKYTSAASSAPIRGFSNQGWPKRTPIARTLG